MYSVLLIALKLEVGAAFGLISFWSQIGFPTMILTVFIATIYLLTLNAIFWQSSVAL